MATGFTFRHPVSQKTVLRGVVLWKVVTTASKPKRTVMTTRRKAIVGTVSAVLLFGLLSGTRSCTSAERERSQIKPGMSASDVFHAINDWDICLGTYFNPDTKEFADFNASKDGKSYHIRAKGETNSHQVNSLEGLIQAIEKQMNEGQSWHIEVSYVRSYPRATFRVDFDSHGKVKNLADVVLGP
jgi:hypothetical protein